MELFSDYNILVHNTEIRTGKRKMIGQGKLQKYKMVCNKSRTGRIIVMQKEMTR